MKKAKRNIIIATVLVFVCAAVYLNWSYNRADETDTALTGEGLLRPGQADPPDLA